MPSLLRISEAASLALHGMALLATEPERRMSTREMAGRLHASEAHLAKVMQRLGRAGLVRSVRGRGGGFTLARRREAVKLLDVYQAVEGKLPRSECLIGAPVCTGEQCVMGGLLQVVDTWLRAYLSGTRLSELTRVYGGEHGKAQEHHQN